MQWLEAYRNAKLVLCCQLEWDEMADIIDEINEELKQERMQALFAKYGKYVGAFAAAVVAIVVASQAYTLYEQSSRETAANAYFSALGEDEIGASLAAASGDMNDGYLMLSEFVTAAELVRNEQSAEAVALYNAIAADSSNRQIYRDFATLLAVRHASETADADTLLAQIAPVAEAASPLQGLALELQADIALKSGDVAAAKSYLEQIGDLQDIPNGLRQRAASLLIALGS